MPDATSTVTPAVLLAVTMLLSTSAEVGSRWHNTRAKSHTSSGHREFAASGAIRCNIFADEEVGMFAYLKKTLLDFFVGAVEIALRNFAKERRHFDVERIAYLLAAVESAEFFQDAMATVDNHMTRLRLLTAASSQVWVDGLWLEFGVADGTSIREIARMTSKEIHGFDSFEGLPEDWTHFQKKGRFSRGGALPDGLPSNVKLVKGWFSETLPSFLKQHAEPAAFIHVDCDLYSSTKTVLTELRDRIQKGTVIVFDEFFNYPGWRNHEFKAFNEFIEEHQIKYQFIGFASSVCSVAVLISDI
jgi:hypothetical protein